MTYRAVNDVASFMACWPTHVQTNEGGGVSVDCEQRAAEAIVAKEGAEKGMNEESGNTAGTMAHRSCGRSWKDVR